MAEKDHYRYGMERKVDPSIPVLRQRIRDLEITLRSAHAELEEHGHQELPERHSPMDQETQMEPETCSSCEGAGWVEWEESTDRTKYPCPNCQDGRDYAFSQTYNRNHPMPDDSPQKVSHDT